MTAKRRVSATSVYFESMPYRLDESTGLVRWALCLCRGSACSVGAHAAADAACRRGHSTGASLASKAFAGTSNNPCCPPLSPVCQVDYDMLEKTATLFRPKLIIAGACRCGALALGCLACGDATAVLVQASALLRSPPSPLHTPPPQAPRPTAATLTLRACARLPTRWART